MKRVFSNEKGSILIPVLIGFAILMWSLIPVINNLFTWKSNLINMEKQVSIDNAINSGVSLALNEININDFLGNKSYIYNQKTYEIEYESTISDLDVDEQYVKVKISLPNSTKKKAIFIYDKDLKKIIRWEEYLN